jgi:hypothetical protein
MKKYILFISIIILISCEDSTKKEPINIISYKVVKDKKEKTETTHKHVYSIWKGDFVLQPNVETVYYIIYDDGSYDSVDIGKYSIIDIGDSIKTYTNEK